MPSARGILGTVTSGSTERSLRAIDELKARAIPEKVMQARQALVKDLARRALRVGRSWHVDLLPLRRSNDFRSDLGSNLVGVALTRQLRSFSLVVFLAKVFDRERVATADSIPAEVLGIPTEIREVGYPRAMALTHAVRMRPVQAGMSVAPLGPSISGTIGLIGVDRHRERRKYLLSNNHVFADENRVPIGTAIVQPSPSDGGLATDAIARLSRYEPLRFGNQLNWMDAAIAEVNPGEATADSVYGLWTPPALAAPVLGMAVQKSGRTTNVTAGVVDTVAGTLFNVAYDGGAVRMDGVFTVTPGRGTFCDVGDSGSCIVSTLTGHAVGLLFGGNDANCFAVPIQRVMRRFGLQLG